MTKLWTRPIAAVLQSAGMATNGRFTATAICARILCAWTVGAVVFFVLHPWSTTSANLAWLTAALITRCFGTQQTIRRCASAATTAISSGWRNPASSWAVISMAVQSIRIIIGTPRRQTHQNRLQALLRVRRHRTIDTIAIVARALASWLAGAFAQVGWGVKISATPGRQTATGSPFAQPRYLIGGGAVGRGCVAGSATSSRRLDRGVGHGASA